MREREREKKKDVCVDGKISLTHAFCDMHSFAFLLYAVLHLSISLMDVTAQDNNATVMVEPGTYNKEDDIFLTLHRLPIKIKYDFDVVDPIF